MRRQERLRKGAEFDTVYSKGTVIGGPLVVLRHLPNDVGHPRWGFAVGKRLAKHAVDRNRTKRRLGEAARRLELTVPYDIIVTARAGSLSAGFDQLVEALRKSAKKARFEERAE